MSAGVGRGPARPDLGFLAAFPERDDLGPSFLQPLPLGRRYVLRQDESQGDALHFCSQADTQSMVSGGGRDDSPPFFLLRQRADFIQSPAELERPRHLEHLAHALVLSRKVDQDGQPIYRIQGDPEAIAVLRRYRDTVRTKTNVDHGEAVLNDMKDLL